MGNDDYAMRDDFYRNIEFDYGDLGDKTEEITEEVSGVDVESDTDNGNVSEECVVDAESELSGLNLEGTDGEELDGEQLDGEELDENASDGSRPAEQASEKYVTVEMFEGFAERMEAKLDYICDRIAEKNELAQKSGTEVQGNSREEDTISAIDKLKEEIENINSQMMKMVAYVNELNRNTTLHEKIESNLNKELEAYKKDIVAYSKKDIMEKVCEIHSDLSKELDSDVVKENDKFVKIIKYYSSYLESILRRNQVEIRKVNVGDEYDENISEVGDTVATNDESLNGKIGAVESVAYVYNSGLRNLLLKPARVKLYKYTNPNSQYCPCSPML